MRRPRRGQSSLRSILACMQRSGTGVLTAGGVPAHRNLDEVDRSAVGLGLGATTAAALGGFRYPVLRFRPSAGIDTDAAGSGLRASQRPAEPGADPGGGGPDRMGDRRPWPLPPADRGAGAAAGSVQFGPGPLLGGMGNRYTPPRWPGLGLHSGRGPSWRRF